MVIELVMKSYLNGMHWFCYKLLNFMHRNSWKLSIVCWEIQWNFRAEIYNFKDISIRNKKWVYHNCRTYFTFIFCQTKAALGVQLNIPSSWSLWFFLCRWGALFLASIAPVKMKTDLALLDSQPNPLSHFTPEKIRVE